MKKIMLIVGILIVLIIIVMVILGLSRSPAVPTPSVSPFSWEKYEFSPVIAETRGDTWNYQPGDPLVMKDGIMYKMWFGANEKEHGITQIGYAQSPDGIQWDIHPEPVLRIGSKETYDATVVETPNVIKDEDGTYHMWYSSVNKFGGDGDEAVYRIGHATSPDGIHWTKDSKNPVIRPADVFANEWTSWGVLEPTVIKEGDIFRMWFTGLVASPPDYTRVHYRLGYATSRDGSMWNLYPSSPLMEFCTGRLDQGKWLNSGFTVTHKGTVYEFWYLGGDCPDVYATSPDGISWQRYSGQILPKGGGSSWDSYTVYSPTILIEENIYKLWYSGMKIDFDVWRFGIGYATGSSKD